jgi:hypothetical protein
MFPQYLHSPRVPFDIGVRRKVRAPLLVAVATESARDIVRIRELLHGTRCELCDLEGESALLHTHRTWYRAHLDELLNNTHPVVRSRAYI